MSKHIRVMTYNVHSCIGTDRKYSTERIAEIIYRSGADIVALQEVDSGLARTGMTDQALELARFLNMHFHFHPSLFREEGAYGNALLSRFPLRLVRAGALPIPRGLRRFERRGAIWAEVTLPELVLQVVSTHFGLIRLERLQQLLTLMGGDWLGSALCRPPIILCGDFNASPRSQVYRRIVGGFHDVQQSLPGWSPRNTWPSRYPFVRIDHIFITPDIKVTEAEVISDQLTRRASDHLPLMATLHLGGCGAMEA